MITFPLRRAAGFTLIELMIVMAIIGILAGLATVVYVSYSARATVGSALADLTPVKTAVEEKLSRGVAPGDLTVSLGDPAYIGVPSQTNYCDVSIVGATSDGAVDIQCEIRVGPPSVRGGTLLWRRGASGDWDCVTSVDPAYRPKVCS